MHPAMQQPRWFDCDAALDTPAARQRQQRRQRILEGYLPFEEDSSVSFDDIDKHWDTASEYEAAISRTEVVCTLVELGLRERASTLMEAYAGLDESKMQVYYYEYLNAIRVQLRPLYQQYNSKLVYGGRAGCYSNSMLAEQLLNLAWLATASPTEIIPRHECGDEWAFSLNPKGKRMLGYLMYGGDINIHFAEIQQVWFPFVPRELADQYL